VASAEHGQQFHIDVSVDDVDRAEAEVLALGATKHEVQPPEGEAWRVYLDPTGHPSPPSAGSTPSTRQRSQPTSVGIRMKPWRS
jgi:Glyoxalase-like domain